MNVFSMAWHFFASMARVQWFKWRGYAVIADPARQGLRNLFCTHCEKYDRGVCGACGCLCEAKITLNSEKCPLNYWPREIIKKKSDSAA